jgi:hypothetical protein
VKPIGYYLRSHRAGEVAAAVIAAAGFGRFWTHQFGTQVDKLPPVLVFCPLACGCAIAASLYEPFGEIERTASGFLWGYRLCLVGTGLLSATTALWLAVGSTAPEVALPLARNLQGFTGMACLATTWLGPRLAWLPILVFSMIMYLSDASRAPNQLPNVLWAWPLARYDNLTSWGLCCCFVVGTALAVVLGPRATPDDQD